MRCTSNFVSGKPHLTQDQHQVIAWMGGYANAAKKLTISLALLFQHAMKENQAPYYISI
jgi:hypothetical protein